MKFLAPLGNYDRQTDRHYCKSSQLFIFHSSVQKMEQVLRWEHGSVTERKSTGQLSNQPTIKPTDEPTERYQILFTFMLLYFSFCFVFSNSRRKTQLTASYEFVCCLYLLCFFLQQHNT